ncbi:flavodoxin FldA [Buchnera aphidicola]|uniref:flavodoxin FldA n=1 Tax=Buchnera aphidicola TaxID=9 RepID=UPI0034646B4D
MKKIGIFFGSDTGNTEKIAKLIQKYMSSNCAQIYDIAHTKKENIEYFDIIIFGIPTWYYGEMQCDWDDFLPVLKKINFKNKIVALFGCGDQEDYSEYFCDGIGIIYNIIHKKGAKIIGTWPTKEYTFISSKALKDSNNFYGMVIDEDRQPEKSEKRVEKWVKQLYCELSKPISNI